MIHKSERPFNFTDRQIAQLKKIHAGLRTLNRTARFELRRIGCNTSTDGQYRKIGKSLETLSIRIKNFLGTARRSFQPARISNPNSSKL